MWVSELRPHTIAHFPTPPPFLSRQLTSPFTPYTFPHPFPPVCPSRVRNLGKMRNFWANFTEFEPEINIVKCKTKNFNKKLEYFDAIL